MKNLILLGLLFILSFDICGQGLNHHYLLGYWPYADPPWTTSGKAKILITNSNATMYSELREMNFISGSQANISDSSGNLLFYTNGLYIANAKGDTMQNGDSLNPGAFSNAYWPYGFPIPAMQIAIPYPDSVHKCILFHQTGNNYDGLNSPGLMYSIIDMDADSGRGAVIIKNQYVFNDKIGFGLAACKHANGRDWWITAMKDSTDSIYVVLITPSGITSIKTQKLYVPTHVTFASQCAFSPNGKKFAYTHFIPPFGNAYRDLRIFDFDRCTGLFSNTNLIVFPPPNNEGFGLSFSGNSKYLYLATHNFIYQFNVDSSNIPVSQQLVATYDGYCYSPGFLCTEFWYMYLAANGRIYISSNNSLLYNVIDSPDSGGVACNVLQHSFASPTYISRNHVAHPNYYLGCDTTLGCGCATGYQQTANHDFSFRLYPNPLNQNKNNLHVGYLLPQYKSGFLKIMDYTGKIIYTQYLPPFTNEHSIKLPSLTVGIYLCLIESGNYHTTKKLVVVHE
nr:T9SS type A sorting domain-containing protein [Bacteroidota bacterium]